MIDLKRISRQQMETEPYRWAVIDGLFPAPDALSDYGGEKDFEYEARALISMGSDAISSPEELSDEWRRLASDFLSAPYRAAMSSLTGIDLSTAPLEVNVFHYPPGGSLDAHPDLRDKIVTHVLYFNSSWNEADGGCLTILRSSNARDVVRTVSPVVGNSAVLVRSDNSWHAVTPVVRN